MDRANELREYQIKRDKLNQEIERLNNIILISDNSLEEKKIALNKSNELFEEYRKLGEDLKKLNLVIEIERYIDYIQKDKNFISKEIMGEMFVLEEVKELIKKRKKETVIYHISNSLEIHKRYIEEKKMLEEEEYKTIIGKIKGYEKALKIIL